MTSNPASNMPTAELSTPTGHFSMRFSSTPRGARLARRLCSERLDTWGIPYGSEAHDALTLVAAELCANAIRHGHVPGRDFHVRLTADEALGTLRIEVTDTRGERLPTPAPADPSANRTDGRGLLLVATLADYWGCHPRGDGPGKTVWAECAIPESAE